MVQLQAPIWSRQRAENEQDWALFTAFLETRSHSAVVARARLDSQTVRAAALRWQWAARALAHDQVLAEALVAERVSLAKRRLAVSQVALTNASGSLARLLELEAEKLHVTSDGTTASTISPRDVSLVAKAVQLQHAADDAVVQAAASVPEVAELEVSDEQLLAIEAILRPVT